MKLYGKRAFTLVELLVIIALLAFGATLLLPALAHVRPNSHVLQCQNNLRRLGCAWEMYSLENGGRLVSSYSGGGALPIPPNLASWCYGNADSSGSAGSYFYDAGDFTGIEVGLLWPYIRTRTCYKCPADIRITKAGTHAGQPVVRTVSMNSCLAGMSYGDPLGSWSWASDPNGPSGSLKYKIFMKENQIIKPFETMVFIEEDGASINDGMFLGDEEGGIGVVDLPGRQHDVGFSISFSDGHAAVAAFKNRDAVAKWPAGGPPWKGGIWQQDWKQIHDYATYPSLP